MQHLRDKVRGSWRLSLAGFAALALIATGCGDEDAESLGTVESPTEVTGGEDASPSPTATDVQAAAGEERFANQLTALNDSGASGSVDVSVDGNELTVSLTVDGVAADLPHAQHIHIGGQNTCPTPDADKDGDDIVSVDEGGPAYGGIVVSLTTDGDVRAESGLAMDRFPMADADGSYTYERTFELPPDANAEDLSDGVVVVHGLADSPLGEDPDAYEGQKSEAGVLEEAAIPVLCGELS